MLIFSLFFSLQFMHLQFYSSMCVCFRTEPWNTLCLYRKRILDCQIFNMSIVCHDLFGILVGAKFAMFTKISNFVCSLSPMVVSNAFSLCLSFCCVRVGWCCLFGGVLVFCILSGDISPVLIVVPLVLFHINILLLLAVQKKISNFVCMCTCIIST